MEDRDLSSEGRGVVSGIYITGLAAEQNLKILSGISWPLHR